MTRLRHLLGVCAFVGVVALVCSSSAGQSGKSSGAGTTPQRTPAKEGSQGADAAAESRFSRPGVVIYQPVKGDAYFAMSVQLVIDAGPPRPRDFLIMLSVSGTQAGASRIAGHQIAEGIIGGARESDRISLWTVNEPKFTTNLTKDFLTPGDHAEGQRLRDALGKYRAKEFAAGGADLKNALREALKTFDTSKDRQRILLFLGDGLSIHAPLSPADRNTIAKMMVERKVAFFPVPLGANLDANTLHGLANSTGGSVLLPHTGNKLAETLKRYEAAFAGPILYSARLQLPAGMTEVCPSVLPPLRADSPTLVVGRMKNVSKQIDYTITGNLDGKKAAVTIKATAKVLAPSADNDFLVSLIEQWAKAKETPAVFGAYRSLALAHDAHALTRGGIDPTGAMAGAMHGMMMGGAGVAAAAGAAGAVQQQAMMMNMMMGMGGGMMGMGGGMMGMGGGMMGMGGAPGMLGMVGMTGAGPLPAKPAPAVAEPVVGREMSVARAKAKDQLGAGVLTAGSFDDNINPQVFSSYVKKMNQLRGLGDLPIRLQGQRVLVIVKDGAGKPVGNARVKLSAGAATSGEVVTRSNGRAVFMLSLDQLPPDQALLATVIGPNGGNAVTDTIAVGSNRWQITLPAVKSQLPKNLDLAIVLDTTGSMQDEIDHLKAEIRSISASIAKKFPEVNQRFALVLYRDEGDEYVVRSFDFTKSLETFHRNIAAQSAAGGGDYPEAMHKGLQAATQLRWQDKDTARVAFLIADAPPHAQHMNTTLAAVNTLRKNGVAIYPVACSGYDDACELVMRSSALLTGSQFLFLTDDSGVGNAHGEPRIPYYQVERFENLMIRMIASELSGQHIEASKADIVRTVGKKVN